MHKAFLHLLIRLSASLWFLGLQKLHALTVITRWQHCPTTQPRHHYTRRYEELSGLFTEAGKEAAKFWQRSDGLSHFHLPKDVVTMTSAAFDLHCLNCYKLDPVCDILDSASQLKPRSVSRAGLVRQAPKAGT